VLVANVPNFDMQVPDCVDEFGQVLYARNMWVMCVDLWVQALASLL